MPRIQLHFAKMKPRLIHCIFVRLRIADAHVPHPLEASKFVSFCLLSCSLSTQRLNHQLKTVCYANMSFVMKESTLHKGVTKESNSKKKSNSHNTTHPQLKPIQIE